MTMTTTKSNNKPPRKVRPKLVPITSSSSGDGCSPGKDGADDSFSRSFDDGGLLGFGDILTAASATPAKATAPVALVENEVAAGVEEDHDDNDVDIRDGIDNGHLVAHEENGVKGGVGVGAAGMAENVENRTSLSLPEIEDDSSTDSEDDDDDNSISTTEPESEASDDINIINHQHHQLRQVQQSDENSSNLELMHQLQCEIHSRQKLLTKILRGKEGTAYATMIQNQETLVNSQLLDRMRMKGREPIAATDGRTSLKSAIHSILLDEYYHTLPGAMSLILHCVLYITTYALIVKFVNLLCDILIIVFTGWDIKTNDFDCTLHEHAFHAILLILSLLASRITGAIYDWNDNKLYQRRIAFQLRNKWILNFWDSKLLNFFHSDSTRMKYECYHENLPCWNDGEALQNGTATTAAATASSKQCHHHPHQRRKLFGWRVKYMLDLFSFFFCYKSVEYFLYNVGVIPLSEITDEVWANLPSRHVHNQSLHGTSSSRDILLDRVCDEHPRRKLQPGQQHRIHFGGDDTAGVSYACTNVRSALDNPYALDMLSWIAKMEFQSVEIANWIANAKNCGWSGVVAGGDDAASLVEIEASTKDQISMSIDDNIVDDDEVQSVHVVNSDDKVHQWTCITPQQIREGSENSYEGHDARENESYYPEMRRISAQDADYIRSTVASEAYYEFIRSPNPRFFDYVKEQLFWFATTFLCLGLLYICDIPFLLI